MRLNASDAGRRDIARDCRVPKFLPGSGPFGPESNGTRVSKARELDKVVKCLARPKAIGKYISELT